MSDDARVVLFAKISPEIKSALTSTAARLNMSSQAYAEQAIARAIAADAGRVALANTEHSEEIERLVESANELISLSNRYSHRGGK